jgi:hypothetical protein
MAMIFGSAKKRNNKKLTSLYEDIKKCTINVQRLKSKGKEGETSSKEYCKMIKIDDLHKILEEHFGN